MGTIEGDGVRSLKRGVALLQAMNHDPAASVKDLASRAGIARSTAYRLLDTFVDMGLVRLERTGGYRLTRQVLSLSQGFPDEDWLEPAWAEMVSLGQSIAWPLALFTANAGLLVIRRTTHEHNALSIDYGMTGKRASMTQTAAGLAYLAFCSSPERDLLLSLPASHAVGASLSGANGVPLDAELLKIRERGFATCVGALNPKTASISVPIIVDSRVLGCLSVIWMRSAQTMDHAITQLQTPLKATADRIARRAEELLLDPT